MWPKWPSHFASGACIARAISMGQTKVFDSDHADQTVTGYAVVLQYCCSICTQPGDTPRFHATIGFQKHCHRVFAALVERRPDLSVHKFGMGEVNHLSVMQSRAWEMATRLLREYA